MLFRASKFATANIELSFEMGKKTPLVGQNFKYPLYIIYIYIYIYIYIPYQVSSWRKIDFLCECTYRQLILNIPRLPCLENLSSNNCLSLKYSCLFWHIELFKHNCCLIIHLFSLFISISHDRIPKILFRFLWD